MRTSTQKSTTPPKKAKRGTVARGNAKTSWRANQVSKLKVENAVTDLCNAIAAARSKGTTYPTDLDAELRDLAERADSFYWSALRARFGNELRA